MTIDINSLVSENLEVAEKYLELNKFETINVIGNRILQDLYSINARNLMAIGLIIKEISIDLQQIHSISKDKPKKKQPLSEDLTNSVKSAQECIEQIKANISKEFSPTICWTAYIEFEDNIRKYLIPQEEREIYSDNYEFSKTATISYLKFLISNKDHLMKKTKIPIERTRSEFSLMINLHGGKIPTICYLFLRAFEHTTRFAIFGKIDDDSYRSYIQTNLELISDIVDAINDSDEETVIEKAHDMVCNLMYEYRDYFIKYGELSAEFSEGVPLSPDIAERIQKVIDKSRG